MTVREHYNDLLADIYTWMAGNFRENCEKNSQFFIRNKILPGNNGSAADLGCGSGFQAIPLAELGFNVTAIDLSGKLLGELERHAGEKKITVRTAEADLLEFERYIPGPLSLVVCMGDTLTHLDSLGQVEEFLNKCHDALEKGGKFILSWRDLSTELENESRFIPVRSDANRIFTCFLEYFPDHVKIFDILQEKKDGKWEQKVSWYKKLKLPAERVEKILEDTGFEVIKKEAGRMVTVISRKV